ncbi:MAG: acetylornithine deacetylase/succinyl-diaminopimelate desuccinylase-like protein [Saprospiraceae bacterium]|jgi:acetylornithine deacetylase/succinyl-diaminopimelate desuccinylase-like protein
MQKVQEYHKANKERYLEELLDLLRIPSISADPAYKNDVNNTAKAVAKALKNAGADNVEICLTKGYPIVYADKIVGKDLPTILVYGHYDVQPPDPLELWDSPPFEPVIKKTKHHPQGAIFARGSCDDKGQMYMHVKAFEAMNKTKSLPCNVKFMIEGEEEVGSNNLGPFCKKNKKKLACDVVLISDTSIIANKVPSITTGLRGLSYIEVEVTGPNRDLHSGVYGGAVANPINVLSKMIASLHDKNNKITIPGFYDEVEIVSKTERKAMNQAPFSLDAYKKELKIKDIYGEKGYTTLERTSIRPTLDVNGIWGGYIGEGAKTVLPSKAFAKISMRLVPGQDPVKITKLFTAHFKSIAPEGVTVKVHPHHGGQPAVTPTNSVEYKAAHMALEKTFKKEPIPQRSGGSIPIVALFEEVLNVKSVLMGFGLATDDIHSPNEHYGLFNYYKGIETIPYFYQYYTELKK